jgi:UDP-2-acetamido-3-amino-2,3-dideoxy-glucuronate N-acetyltransferase
MGANMRDSATPRIAAVGCGYWGKNIVRNFAELGALSAVCDTDFALANEFAKKYSVPALSLPQILNDNQHQGVAFASPAAMHVQHASDALRAGKHVFVEKPMALTVPEGRALANLAIQTRRILMVGHLLHYHPLVLKLFDLVREGRLGEIKHVYSNRLNIGKIRTQEDVIWSFAPHDLSMILGIMGHMPDRVSVEASCILDPKIADIANIHMNFANGATARVFVSWLNPYKEQKLSVIGSRAHAVFDDAAKWDEKLVIYDHRVEYRGGHPEAVKAGPQAVHVEQREPLREECAHFLDAISGGTAPRTDSREALRVLALLEAATRSLETGGPVAPDAGERA